VRGAGGKHVVGRDEDLSADGHGGAFVPAAGLEAEELVLEVGSLLSCCGVGCLDQGGLQVHVAFTNSLAAVLTRALVVAGADSRPGSKMVRTVEDAHVRTQLSNHYAR